MPPEEKRISLRLESIRFPSQIRESEAVLKPETLKPPSETTKPRTAEPVSEPLKPYPAAKPVSVPVPMSEPVTITAQPKAPAIAQPPKPTPAVQRPEPKPEPKKEYKYPYQEQVQSILKGRQSYPRTAKKLKQQGEVRLSFDLVPSGEAKNITIIQSSGFDALDQAAIELVRSASPLLPKPEESVKIVVPLEYVLN